MLFATVHIGRTFPQRVILWIRMKLGCMYSIANGCRLYGWFYQKKLTFKAQTVGSYDFDTSRINMVDTSKEKNTSSISLTD